MEPSKTLTSVSTLGIHEQIYLKFNHNSVVRKIKKNPGSILIKENAEKQKAFEAFVQNNYRQYPITDVHFSTRKLLANICHTIKEIVQATILEGERGSEKICQSIAHRELSKRGQLGRVLTFREARAFTLCAENVNIPALKKLSAKPLRPLSCDEILFLNFIADLLEKSINDESGIIYLGASVKMQIDFINYAKTKNKTYTRKTLNLIGIINVLAYRVQMELKITIDPIDIDDEARCQEVADDALEVLRHKGFQGRMLTARQAKILISYNK